MIKLWQIGGFVFTGIAGVLLHFLYDWTNKSIIVALFSAVNESIWEHMKLLFFPMFVFALVEYKYFAKEVENFWSAKLSGSLIGLAFIPVLYYSYTGIFGVNADWMNILIFFIAAATAYFAEAVIIKNRVGNKNQLLPFAILCVIGALFIVLTFAQPHIPLFRDPVTGEFGI